MSTYLRFSLLFLVIHLACYLLAGIITRPFSKDLYGGEKRLYKSIFRNMEDVKENHRVAQLLLPSQLIRALFMSAVLYPILPCLQSLSFWQQFGFMGGLMFVYADFCSAVPFSHTIEGWVYLKKELVHKKVFWTVQSEAILYSLAFGLGSALFIF